MQTVTVDAINSKNKQIIIKLQTNSLKKNFRKTKGEKKKTHDTHSKRKSR